MLRRNTQVAGLRGEAATLLPEAATPFFLFYTDELFGSFLQFF